MSVRTDANGHASFEYGVAGSPPMAFLTATATNTSTGDTSEYSKNVEWSG